jgi:predicted ArsR family transcriptional regulator
MNSTREKIIRTLLTYPNSTINDLAEAVGINGISIRHHLTGLEAEGLITSEEERHGVGRPRLIYSLTEKGVEKFPTNYLRLTHRILDSLHEKLSDSEMQSLFEEIGADIAKIYAPDFQGKSLSERIEGIQTALSKEGFIIEVEQYNDGYLLRSLSCPYYRIGLEHPVVCSLGHSLISRLLGTPIVVEARICQGADQCVYKIPYKVK